MNDYAEQWAEQWKMLADENQYTLDDLEACLPADTPGLRHIKARLKGSIKGFREAEAWWRKRIPPAAAAQVT